MNQSNRYVIFLMVLLRASTIVHAQSRLPTESVLVIDSLTLSGKSDRATNTSVLVLHKDGSFNWNSWGPSCFTWASSSGYWSITDDTLSLREPPSHQPDDLTQVWLTAQGDTIYLSKLRPVDEVPCKNPPSVDLLVQYAVFSDRLDPVRCSRPDYGNWAFEEYFPTLWSVENNVLPFITTRK